MCPEAQQPMGGEGRYESSALAFGCKVSFAV